MQVALLKQLFLYARLHAFAEQRPVRQNDSAASSVFQKMRDKDKEQVCGLPCAVSCGEVGFNAILLHSSKWRICDDHIHAVGRTVIAKRSCKGIIMPYLGRHLDAMEQHIGNTQKVRKRFLLHARNGALECFFILHAFYIIIADIVDSAGDETSCAACGVKEFFTEFGIDHIHHELGDCTRCIVFSSIACALEVTQYLLVYVAENVAVFSSVKVDLIDLVDDLSDDNRKDIIFYYPITPTIGLKEALWRLNMRLM